MPAHGCYQHRDRQMLAHCSMCARPCCRDCTVEMLGDYFCELCKVRVAGQLHADKVHPDAVRVLLISLLSVFMFGFAVGPYAIWRGTKVARTLERTPWLRGRWHVLAGFALAGFGTALGLVFLLGRYVLDTGG